MSTWTISLDDEGNAASVERGHHPGERAILLVEAPAAAGDATHVIARKDHETRIMVAADIYARHIREHGPSVIAGLKRDALKNVVIDACNDYEGAVELLREFGQLDAPASWESSRDPWRRKLYELLSAARASVGGR